MLQQFGKWLALAGLVLVLAGGLMYLLGRLGVGRLPGDFSVGGRNWRVYIPLGTSILLSILLTLALYILAKLRR